MPTSSFVKRSTLTASAVSLIVTSVFCPSPSHAAIVNGEFDTGDFSGWSAIGNTSIQTSSYASDPTEGTYQALVSTVGDTAAPADLETFLGLLPGSLDNIGGSIAQGSAIKQTFTADAGQTLTFRWNFLTDEATPSQFFNDFSFVTIGSLSKLADTSSAFVTSKTTFNKETGFQTFSYTIPTTDTYALGIGVTNVGDAFGTSGLLVDNVSLSSTPVPEPNSAWVTLAFSVLTIGAVVKRRGEG